MNNFTLKIVASFVLMMFSLSVQGQAWTENGTYRISTSGLTPELFMTVDPSNGSLTWAAELTGNDPTQVWTIVDHRTPVSAGYMEIYATIPNVGDFTMTVDQSTFTGAGDKNITLTVRSGLPIADENDSNYGYDQFQRRKTADPPLEGNDALFVKPPGEGGSRYGVVPTAAGDLVEFDGGGIDQLKFYFIASALSIDKLTESSVIMSNPVKDNVSITGLTAEIDQVNVYSLLGAKVLSKEVNNASSMQLNVGALSKGMYIVDFVGQNGNFTKKLIKQ